MTETKYDKRRSVKTFTEVRRYLNAVPHINNGGCGVSALAMYRWLHKNNQLDNTKFVFLYNDESTFKNNSQALHNKLCTVEAPTHVVLLHKGKFIDCEKEVNLSEWGEFIQVVDESELLERGLDEGDWNEAFNRNYIPKIERKLKVDLSDIPIDVGEY